LLIILARAVSPRESFTVNKYLRNTALFGLLLGVSAAAQERERSATGWISDENCGAHHTKARRRRLHQKVHARRSGHRPSGMEASAHGVCRRCGQESLARRKPGRSQGTRRRTLENHGPVRRREARGSRRAVFYLSGRQEIDHLSRIQSREPACRRRCWLRPRNHLEEESHGLHGDCGL